MSNRLANETSPYLRQHADNPVDWYPWGDEALEKAAQEDRPIFLSIGYSACHWCHVMAHESFEDPETAAFLNEHFINIKVDREERPDLDRIYMSAVQALTGGGGWPLSVFLTPDGRPFYGGTYFPPQPRYGMPSFSQVLESVISAWRQRRQEIVQGSSQLTASIEQQMALPFADDSATPRSGTMDVAVEELRSSFDWMRGGWGQGPKFPQPMVLEFLLRYHHTSGDERALEMVSRSLQAMARGGMYDQLGGGFHRYSVDDRWLVPHFEKMLYDNAQLARVYLHAWQVTEEPLFRRIAEETLDYVAREMTAPEGGFYATQDADTEGEEGKFYLWTLEEIRDLLGDRAEAFMPAYGVTTEGNFEGRNILTFSASMDKRAALAEARQRLLDARRKRVHPARDEKVIVSWNGLMLAAFAEAARVLQRKDYREIAERNAEFLLDQLRPSPDRLRHTWKDGEASAEGYLEDHTHLVEGLLELYRTTFDARWYRAARELVEGIIAHFRAPAGFFDTPNDSESLIVRPRELQDNAVPSGNGMAATVLLRLAGLAVEPGYLELANQALSSVQPALSRYPLGFGQWLVALDYALAHPRDIAIVGPPGAADTQALLEVATAGYQPHRVVAVGDPAEEAIPLLRDREPVDGQAAAYVCVNFTCQAPVTDPEELHNLLEV